MFVQQSSVHGEKFGVGAMFDGAFPVAMHEDGTLFGLLGGMSADVDKRLDDVVESVDIVVPKHQ